MPLLGLLFMGAMMLLCFRGFGCAPRGRRRPDELTALQSELQSLKDDVRKLLRQPH